MGIESLLRQQLSQGTAALLGTREELIRLFGAPLPEFPGGEELPSGGEQISVEMSPRLREALSRWLGAVTLGLGEHPQRAAAGSASVTAEAEQEYLKLITEVCRAVLLTDRRQGLFNLFWVAHSREIAEAIEQHFAGSGREPHLRYQMHPLLSGLLHRAEEMARDGLSRSQHRLLDFRLGPSWNSAVVRSVMDDQLPLTELHPRAFDPDRVLIPANRRFRITAAAFTEINQILRTRLAHGLSRGERPLRQLLGECIPEAAPDFIDDQRSWDRLLFADAVREYLLQDYDEVGSELAKSRILRRERPRETGWSEYLTWYVEVTRCLRRSEVIGALRQAIATTSRSFDHQETRERFLEGRLYRFSAPEGIQSNLRTATILFADLREFTRTAEGPVSERNLTRELYEIFDPAAMIIRRFGGCVDKFLGDGLMATFGGGLHAGREALAATRAAVVMQQALGRLRVQGRTEFHMGISLHIGRVSVAHFLRDEEHVDITLIGRQVNIAGRLSSAGEGGGAPSHGPSPAGPMRVVGDVSLDRTRGLVNRGIAVSGSLLDTLRNLIPLEPFQEGEIHGYRWYDGDLALWLHFGYVGEAHFKGLEDTVPVYSLVSATSSGRIPG